MSDYIDRYAVLNAIDDAIANNALSYTGCVNKIMEFIAKIPTADVIESTSKAYQMMAEAYEAEVTRPKRIPVSERLPDNGVIVLAYYNNFMTEAFYANNQWHELATYAIIPTTHWMPLPEPPKGSES